MPSCIQHNVPLAPYTTLGVGGIATYFATVTTREELVDVVSWAHEHKLTITIIGGGSNILVADEGVSGLVIHIGIEGVTYEQCADDHVLVAAGAGVVLDRLIDDTVKAGVWGLENLSAIPGTVGGVPVQNVGAYGVEVSSVIHHVDVYDCGVGEYRTLDAAACTFGYRDSIFKHEGKHRYIIVGVTFLLSRTPMPRIEYADLRYRFSETTPPTQHAIRSAIIEIRTRKFPDWHVIGTAGSFFKNPTVNAHEFAQLRHTYPETPAYAQENGTYKIALGWILDQVLHLKGYREGCVGLYENQALVLVNYGGATAHEIIAFSDTIIQRVFDATGIRIEREVVHVT